MTNIWADSYKEIRKPFFDTESLEEERAKKDYDGDGKIESGAKEYRGSVHNAIQKKKGGKPDGQDTSSVKEDVEQVEERVDVTRQSSKRKSLGKYKGNYESPKGFRKTEIEDAPYQSKGSYNAHLTKEEAETIAEVDSYSTPKKVDVIKGGKKNKITINPPIKEEIEAWIGELVEEGYNLSQFTMDEIIEIYESVELEEQMPARGDAENVNVTDQAKLSAKRRMAQAQIRADLARVQFQKASMTKESVDSIVEYLSQRTDAFENLEEGVFDPKKSKMRPASERTKKVMTDAQRKAAKKESERVAAIHSKGETVLAGMRPQGKKGKVKTTPDAKPAAPQANRKVTGRYDKLAKAASQVLKDSQK